MFGNDYHSAILFTYYVYSHVQRYVNQHKIKSHHGEKSIDMARTKARMTA